MKLYALNLMMVVALTGCGSSDDASNSNGSPTEKNEHDTNKTVDVSVLEEQVDLQARLVKPDDEYPPCQAEGHGKLIFVQDEKSFYFCDENVGWMNIDLRGKDGADGATGQAGRDGKDGKDGQDGQDGTDAVVDTSSTWVHPISGVKYFLINETVRLTDVNEFKDPCPAGSELPGPGASEELRGILAATGKVSCYAYGYDEGIGNFRATCKLNGGDSPYNFDTFNGGTVWSMDSNHWVCKVL